MATMDRLSNPEVLQAAEQASKLLERRDKARTRLENWREAKPGGTPSEIKLAEVELAAAERQLAEVEAEFQASRGDFIDGAQAQPMASRSTPLLRAGAQPPATPVQRQLAQEAAILSALKELGYEPQALPANVPGKAGVKAAVRRALGPGGMWAGTTVLDKAWQRSIDKGAIGYGK